VKITNGPNVNSSYVGCSFRVDFIIGTSLIVFSPAIVSNRGLMAVEASLVQTPEPPKVSRIHSQNRLYYCQTHSITQIDPSMPAPFSGGFSSGGGMQQGSAQLPGGLTIGSSVRIVKGVHKGKDGVVRKMMGNKLSVQVSKQFITRYFIKHMKYGDNLLSAQVRGGQQVEVSAEMIKSSDPNSAQSFGLSRSEDSQSQPSYRTPHVPFSPAHSLTTSSPAPPSPAPSGWSGTHPTPSAQTVHPY
jgi:hypothetical protein